MGWNKNLRNFLRLCLTGREDFVLEKRVPQLEDRFDNLDALGLYLHIPFCRQICPYCPYNKELYRPEIARRYAMAVTDEIKAYAKLLGNVPITSFYIGGGTPTTMLFNGLSEILDQIERSFNMQCDIHMESHPSDLNKTNLEAIVSMNVAHLSIGVEALQNHHLKTLHRTYTADEARAAVTRAVGMGFACVNTDFIFALPNQTPREAERTAEELIRLGSDQITAYPLFTFPYTPWTENQKETKYSRPNVLERRKVMEKLEHIFHEAGFERTSVWAFTRRGKPKYCSVTVPRYIGLGASGGSYLDNVLYFNTFNVNEYIAAVENGGTPIGLSMELSRKMQMTGWLYWRIYETHFRKFDFKKRFGVDFENVYGFYTKVLAAMGFLQERGDVVQLTDHGAYWLHVLQDLFSIDYISELWGISQKDPWPNTVVL